MFFTRHPRGPPRPLLTAGGSPRCSALLFLASLSLTSRDGSSDLIALAPRRFRLSPSLSLCSSLFAVVLDCMISWLHDLSIPASLNCTASRLLAAPSPLFVVTPFPAPSSLPLSLRLVGAAVWLYSVAQRSAQFRHQTCSTSTWPSVHRTPFFPFSPALPRFLVLPFALLPPTILH